MIEERLLSEEIEGLRRAAEQGQPLERGWSWRGWRKRTNGGTSMAENQPVQLTKATKVKDPDTGEQVELAPGTELSAATAKKLGIKPEKR